jgi:DNA-binding NarL/FixJ family response regulator
LPYARDTRRTRAFTSKLQVEPKRSRNQDRKVWKVMEGHCGLILIADDDAGFRALVSMLCAQAGYDCVEAATRDEAVTAALARRPDAVLLDVDLGETSGYEVCRELRERFGESLPIIFLSGTRTETFDRVAGLLLGADDYVTKPFEPEELLARVRRSIARTPRPSPSLPSDRFHLTPRECEILGLFAEGLGTQEISDRLEISAKTVSSHTQRMLPKLGVHSRTEAVALAYREGLLETLPAPRA